MVSRREKTIQVKKAASNAEMRRRLLYAAAGLTAVLAAAAVYNMVSAQRAFSRVGDALRDDIRDNGKTRDELEASGVLPRGSMVLSSPGEIVKALDANTDSLNHSLPRRAFEKVFNRIVAPSQVMSGANALYVRREGGKPVLALPPGRLSPFMVRHEVGHFLADSARPQGDYLREYASAARRIALSALVNPDKERDSKGRLTRYGLEVEAWDRAGVPPDNRLRRLALATYRGKARRDALAAISLVSGLAGLGLGIYALRRYPMNRISP